MPRENVYLLLTASIYVCSHDLFIGILDYLISWTNHAKINALNNGGRKTDIDGGSGDFWTSWSAMSEQKNHVDNLLSGPSLPSLWAYTKHD